MTTYTVTVTTSITPTCYRHDMACPADYPVQPGMQPATGTTWHAPGHVSRSRDNHSGQWRNPFADLR
jgi:hypothetical protein